MRLLVFSDLHRDRERAERLVELAQEADVVVGAGDYATMRMGRLDLAEELDRGRGPGRALTAVRLSRPGARAMIQSHPPRRSVLQTIEDKRPILAVCGHIHQCWGGEAGIGTTPVVNVGPDGRFIDI